MQLAKHLPVKNTVHTHTTCLIISYNSVLYRKLHMYMEGREREKEEETKERGKGENERSAMKDPCTPSNGTNVPFHSE